MGLIGRKIIQTRTYVNPNPPSPPSLNYEEEFPITVFDAVREEMGDENSRTLREILDQIQKEIQSKQPIFAARPANYLMTYGGAPGATGAIQISQEIPWDEKLQRGDRIPTEKAVGKLLSKAGLLDDDGNVIEGGSKKVQWAEIIGKPMIYHELGMNSDGFLTQKAVTDAIEAVKTSIRDASFASGDQLTNLAAQFDDHKSNFNNPHHVTLGQIGAMSKEVFEQHLIEENPHHITKAMLGLENVENTSDVDKPISLATQDALNLINRDILNIKDSVDALNYIDAIDYNQTTGKLLIYYKNGAVLDYTIAVDGLIDDIQYDEKTKELILIDLGGHRSRVLITDLFVRYLGSTSPHITVVIDNEQESGVHTIQATINPHSITANELAPGAVQLASVVDKSITGDKIQDLSITTINLANESITTEKIKELSITNGKLDTRSVNGRVLFSSTVDNRVLAVLKAGTDPVYTQINSEMLDVNSVLTKHLNPRSVTSEKLADQSVSNRTILDYAVTNEKLSANAVTNEKILESTITGNKLVENPEFQGSPTITKRPSGTSNDRHIPDTQWVRDRIREMVLVNENLGDRIVNGRSLFTSDTRNRALVVKRAKSDPEWGLINHEMIDTDAIDTEQLVDKSVTKEKLADQSITSRNFTTGAIETEAVHNDAITSEKIYKSDVGNRVLAALVDNGNPVYTQINRNMIENYAISSMQIEDRSITLAKLKSSSEANMVLAVSVPNTNPNWTKITGHMIADRTVAGRNIFTSSGDNRVLGVQSSGDDPSWLKINSNMLEDEAVTTRKIANESITSDKIQPGSIKPEHLSDITIPNLTIGEHSIGPDKLFQSEESNCVLTVAGAFTDPQWTQVATDMIEDKAITREKIFQSSNPYRVLGTTQAGVPPEYTMITHQFIVDGTIIPQKLQKNFTLLGTPEVQLPPAPDADNHQIPDTAWVRKTIANLINDFHPDLLYDTITSEMIGKHQVDGTNLFTSEYAPRVLGITEPNGDVEYLLIEEDLIADAAVTSNKLQRSIQLYGSPTLEVRPSSFASDNRGGGDLIPDCQWVLDRIQEYMGGETPDPGDDTDWREITQPEVDASYAIDGAGSTDAEENELDAPTIRSDYTNQTPPELDKFLKGEISKAMVDYAWQTDGLIPFDTANDEDPSFDDEIPTTNPDGTSTLIPGLTYGSITTDLLQDRAITAQKFFTSEIGNRVLAVLEPNTDPVYTTIHYEMVDDRIIDGKKLFTSEIGNRVLVVNEKNTDPSWGKINHEMIEDDTISTEQLKDRSVTTNKIDDYSIDKRKFKREPMIDDILLDQNSVGTDHLKDQSVINEKIQDGTITTEKIADHQALPEHTSVKSNTNYQEATLRNIIISPDPPKGGNDGDIWLQYI